MWEAFAEFTYIAFQIFFVVVVQYLLSLIDWDFVIHDGSTVARNCFGQVVCLSFPFRPACPLTQWKLIEVEFLVSVVFNLVATAKGCVVCLFVKARSVALESKLIAFEVLFLGFESSLLPCLFRRVLLGILYM